MSDLLSCPFCGSSRVEIVGYFPFVRCKGCGAETDNYSDEEAAAEAWNTRAERTCKVVNYNRYMFSCSVSLDDTNSPNLVDLASAPELSDWVEARYLDQILSIAASELREAISDRIEEIEQEEAKAGDQDAN